MGAADDGEGEWHRAQGSIRERRAADRFLAALTGKAAHSRRRGPSPAARESHEDCGCGGGGGGASEAEHEAAANLHYGYAEAFPDDAELEGERLHELAFEASQDEAALIEAALAEGGLIEAGLIEAGPAEAEREGESDELGFDEAEGDESDPHARQAGEQEHTDDEESEYDESAFDRSVHAEAEYAEAALDEGTYEQLGEAAPLAHHCVELSVFRGLDMTVDGNPTLVTAPTATTPPELSLPAPTSFRTIAGLDSNFATEEEPTANPREFFTFTRGRALLDTGHLRVDPGNAALFQVRLRGLLCHPADAAQPQRLPAGTERLPVVVIVHGNHTALDFAFVDAGGPRRTRTVASSAGPVTQTLIPGRASVRHEVRSYRGYRDLQEHLASLGIVSVSLDTNAANEIGSLIRFRADLVLAMLDHLRSLDTTPGTTFTGRLDLSKVGLVGHSRGGDAVAMAAELNRTRAAGTACGVRAVVTISPTDFTGMLTPGSARLRMSAATTASYLSIYGSHDGDVSGSFGSLRSQGWGFVGTGFRHYDRATTQRAMVFIHGATHNRFNQVWITPAEHAVGSPARRLAESQADNFDDEPAVDPRKPASTAFPLPAANRDARVLSDAAHRTLSREYVGGWLELWLMGRWAQAQRFTGAQANSLGTPVGLQWKLGRSLRTIDNFDDANPALNVEGGAITLPPFVREQLIELTDLPQIPHNDRGLRALPPSGAARVYRSEIPVTARDWSSLNALTFRIAKHFPDVRTPSAIGAAAFPPNFEIALFDGTHRRAVDQTVIAPLNPRTVPPYHRIMGSENLTKVHLQTWQVPLSRFTGPGGVSLSSIVAVEISFDARAGEPINLDTLSAVQL
jgi:hypothetical protein